MYTSYVTNISDQQTAMAAFPNLVKNSSRTKCEDVLDYVYDWAAWAAGIPDPARRSEVQGFVMKTLERALKDGMERTGITLGPKDVTGTKSGTKTTLEGEVNIRVIITSSVKETTSNKPAAQSAEDNPSKHEQAETDAAAASVPSEPNPELLQSIEKAAKASFTKKKRPAGDMGHSDKPNGIQDAKRLKTKDREIRNKQVKQTTADDKQQGSTLNDEERQSHDTTLSLSPEEELKKAQYRQQIFQTRLNHILKRAGKVQARGKCSRWDTVKTRLKDAGVRVKYRNIMLNDFHFGYEAWNGDENIDPNEELADFAHTFEVAGLKASEGSGNKAQAGAEQKVLRNGARTAMPLSVTDSLPTFNADSPIPNGFIPAQPVSFSISRIPEPSSPLIQASPANLFHHSQTLEPAEPTLDVKTRKTLIVKLDIGGIPGFDPDDYSIYNQYQHENFMFSFTPQSTVKERVQIGDTLIRQVDARLNKAIDRKNVLYSETQLIRNQQGKVIVKGNFVDLNSDYMVQKGLADPEKPWMWQGRTFKDKVVQGCGSFPSNSLGPGGGGGGGGRRGWPEQEWFEMVDTETNGANF